MARITRSQIQELQSKRGEQPTFQALKDKTTPRLAAYRAKTESGQRVNDVLMNEEALLILVESLMGAKYYWRVCEGIDDETVGKKLAMRYNRAMGITGTPKALSWVEANKCFQRFEKNFQFSNKHDLREWEEILEDEKTHGLRRRMLEYIVYERNYKQRVLNEEIATLSAQDSDCSYSSSDSESDTEALMAAERVRNRMFTSQETTPNDSTGPSSSSSSSSSSSASTSASSSTLQRSTAIPPGPGYESHVTPEQEIWALKYRVRQLETLTTTQRDELAKQQDLFETKLKMMQQKMYLKIMRLENKVQELSDRS